MVKKNSSRNNQKNQKVIKISSIFLILLFTILMFFSIFPVAGCMEPTRFIRNDDDKFEENKPGTIENELNYIPGEVIMLPDPEIAGQKSFEETLFKRRSTRSFADKEIELDKISQLLWAAQGITEKSRGYRTAPSAGALYPLDVFIAKKDGLFHYIPEKNELRQISYQDQRNKLYEACIYQSAVAEGAINIIITAVYERTTGKYGDRGIRYVHLEAGHVCQNILLQAVALDLGAVPVGAFEDNKINEIMKLPDNYVPLYVIPVGYPE